jgi:hypothetical protein
MSKHTNLDIKDVACLHIAHIVQHPTSCPTTQSMQPLMVIAPKKNCWQLLAGRYCKSAKLSTQPCHQANEGESTLQAERVQALVALHCLGPKKKLTVEELREIHFSSNKEKSKWIQDYAERETAGATK